MTDSLNIPILSILTECQLCHNYDRSIKHASLHKNIIVLKHGTAELRK